MSLSTKPYKGARDFYPEDKRVQNYMFGVLRSVVEKFGYQEYDAPIIEPLEIYTSKTSQEIVAEQTYSFTDRGGRNVTLRPEMTPTVSRMVAARRQELSYPLRWYSIPNLWRYERPQHGRLREHWQLNVDLFGVPGVEGDHEVILVADSVMRAFGAKRDQYEIRINSRALVNWLLLEYLRLDYTQAMAMIRVIDHIHKMPDKQFLTAVDALLSPQQRDSGIQQHLIGLLRVKKLEELPAVTQQHPAVSELARLMNMLGSSGASNMVFDLTLMRGFDYYTNIVFEVFDKHPSNNRSMFGGGRYDTLLAEFGVEPLPSLGFGMGDVTLQNFLESHKLLPDLPPEVDAVAILIGEVYEKAQKTLENFRQEGIKLAVDSTNRKLNAQIKSAVKADFAYALFIGDEELEKQRFRLKNLVTGAEEQHSFERVVSKLASRHPHSVDL